MQNIRSSRHKKASKKRKIIAVSLTLILIIFTLIFIKSNKINDYNGKNATLKQELQELKTQNSSLLEKNKKLNKEYSDLKSQLK